MANTSCQNCLFAKPSNNIQSCLFDIPNILTQTYQDKVSIMNEYNYIHNYQCRYGLSQESYSKNSELQNIDIQDYAINNAKIKYYLVIDTRESNIDYIYKLCEHINNMDIKPQLISFIVDIKNTADFIEIFNDVIKNIKWKIHSFLNNLSINDAINIAAETNLIFSQSALILFADIKLYKDTIDLNNYVNYIQYSTMVIQNFVHGLKFRSDNIHHLCLPIHIYHSMLSQVGRDIIKAINTTPELVIKDYDIKSSI